MTTETIGEAGDVINNSMASSAMNIAPDVAQIEKYDTLKGPTTIIDYLVWVITALVAAGVIYLFLTGHWIIGALGVILTAFCAMVSYYTVTSTAAKQMTYEDGLLVPGMIVNLSPLEIIVLVNMCSSEDTPTTYGCKKIQVGSLPGHAIEVGEEVPCATLFLGSKDGCYQTFMPRPICWGYSDSEKIKSAAAAIFSEEDYESVGGGWDALRQIAPVMANQAPEKIVLFNADLQVI